MRVPHPQTLSRALAAAEALTERGQPLHLTAAQARALVYETSAQQGIVHFRGDCPSHGVCATEVWDAAGYPDVQRIVGCWCGRGDGLTFALTVVRPNGDWNIDIRTPALPNRPR